MMDYILVQLVKKVIFALPSRESGDGDIGLVGHLSSTDEARPGTGLSSILCIMEE